jgi:hypothetical protein
MNQPVLRSRQQSQALAPAGGAAEQLDVELRRAKAIASARDALPRSYKDNPGAVLLADQWARARGIDTLTAIQNVAFINGRPVIDATFQRALAVANGYDLAVLDATNEAATVAVARDGKELGRVTWTMDDARRANLAGKDTWKQYPRNMLIARATTDALRWYAAEVLLGVFSADELESDPIEVLRPVEPTEVEQPVPTAAVEVEEDIADAVLEPEPEWTADTLKQALREQGMTQVTALRTTGCVSIEQLAADPAKVAELLAPVNEAQPTFSYTKSTIDDSAPF